VPPVARPPPPPSRSMAEGEGGVETSSTRRQTRSEINGPTSKPQPHARDLAVVESERRAVQRCWSRLLHLGARRETMRPPSPSHSSVFSAKNKRLLREIKRDKNTKKWRQYTT
jgi:hypothetical protein